MKRLLTSIIGMIASRIVPLVVMLFFLLLYVCIAFFSDEPLFTLILFVQKYSPLAMILALIPFNCIIRLITQCKEFLRLRSIKNGRAADVQVQGVFDESIRLNSNVDLRELERRLSSFGYRVSLSDYFLYASRGITLFPVRMLMLFALCFLFSGILLSTVTRSSKRVPVIERELFPFSEKDGDRVKRISLIDNPGLFFERTLSIEVSGREGESRVFGIYPPSLHKGIFVYPRYLGIAPLIRFSAPDLPQGFETHYVLMIYPPGKEDSADIPGTGYRIVFSMLNPEDRKDPFQSGQITLLFRILKNDQPVASGILPLNGEFNEKGYHLTFHDFRRVVACDLVNDSGVILIWIALSLLVIVLLFWVPVRLFFPLREMLFLDRSGIICACSRAEGHRTQHAGIFNDALDLLDHGNSE